MTIKSIIKLFEKGNVSVCGLKGTGKDMLMSNVCIRRNKPYVSNIDYGGMYMPLRLDLLDCGQNSYKDFISGTLKKYEYPYCDNTDVYISDAGVYFPCQYDEQITKQYPQLATLFALSRQIGEFNIHYNSQALGRVYTKMREQSDIFIKCKSCKVLFKKIVIQSGYIYEKYQSAVDGVMPFRMKNPHGIFSKQSSREEFKTLYLLKKQDYTNTHGKIKPFTLIYIHKSTYDTRRFKFMLKEGYINEERFDFKNNLNAKSPKKIS